MMEEPITDPQSEPTSAEEVAENEDLATEIFNHLSATSLAPCLRVSKLWLSIISNQKFISRHNLLYPPSLSGLYLVPRQTAQHPEIHFLSFKKNTFEVTPFVAFLNSKGFQILQSCNGLLLCQFGLSRYVCNPSLFRLRVLPHCPYMEKDYTLDLAFDPFSSPGYKVVCVQKLSSPQLFHQIAIYSSETRLWSLFQEPVVAPNELDFNDGVFCNGAIHWLKSNSSGAYLDLKTGILKEMPQPPRHEESEYRFKYFGKSQGCLLYAVSRAMLNEYEFYQMKEDYSGWDLKIQVNPTVMIAKVPAMARNFLRHPMFTLLECDVLYVNLAGRDEGVEIVFSVPGDVVIRNLKIKNYLFIQDEIFGACDVTIWYKMYSVYEHFETLSVI